MKRTPSVLAALVLGAAVAGAGASTAEAATGTTSGAVARAAAMCHGKKATIVGVHGGSVVGTGRGDVIVSNGAYSVKGRGGDDSICVTGTSGGTFELSLVKVFDGGGDDWVMAKTRTAKVSTTLGTGDDTYIGNKRENFVYVRAAGHDVVDTGAGNDFIDLLEGPGGRAVLHGGPGDDSLRTGRVPTSNVFVGGPGRNALVLMNNKFVPGNEVDRPWTVNNKVGEARTNGKVWIRWKGVTKFDFTFLDTTKTTFTGTFAGERVDFSQAQFDDVGPRRVFARTGGGDDVIAVDSLESGSIGGGTGDDQVSVGGFSTQEDTLDVNLTDGTMRASSPDGVGAFTLTGIQDATARFFTTLNFIGNEDANHFTGIGSCDSTYNGAAGDDVLIAGSVCGGEDAAYGSVAIEGGSGDDLLIGTNFSDDYLNGGAGNDTADGRGGIDRCIAETETNCELP